MTRKKLYPLMSLILIFGLLLGTFSGPTYSATTTTTATSLAKADAKTYPYAIQIGVFDTGDKAARFMAGYPSELKTAFAVKFVKYHVLYNAYGTKAEAEKYLPSARKVSPSAYIFKIKAENQKLVDAQMLKMSPTVQGTATVVTASTPELQPKAEVSKVETPNIGASKLGTSKEVFNQALTSDMIISGVFGDGVINFNVDPNWELAPGSYLDVYMNYPKDQFFSDSSLSFHLNGVPLQSVPLGKNEAMTNHLRIPLEVDKIQSGANAINIKTFIRTAENLCENQTNPANWIVFSKKSYLHLEYKNLAYQSTLSEFPYPYVKSGEDQPVKFKFIYDTAAPNADILDGILGMSSDLGRLNPFKALNYEFVSPKDYTPDQSAIYIGTSVPEPLKKWLPKNTAFPKENLYIYEAQVTPTSQLLFIIATDSSHLKSLSHLLSYKTVVSQMDKNYMTFKPEDFMDYKLESKGDIFTLKDLGYSSTTFEGTKNPSVGYFINTPGNWTIASGTKLILNIRFSTLVDAANSTLTVTVNGIPIGSKTLDSNHANGQTFEFLLPKQVLNANRFNVGLVFSLGGEFDCADLKSTRGFWAYVSNDSYIQFVKSNKKLYNLEDLPSPMVMDQAFKNFNIVLAKNADLNTVKLLADIMSKFGQQTLNQGQFKVVFDQNPKTGNNLVIGTSQDALIRDSNATAVIPYKTDFSGFSPTEGMVFLSSEAKNYATAQLIYNKSEKTSTLWISSPTSAGFEWLGKYLTDSGLSTQIKGSAVFVNRNGLLQVYESPESKKESQSEAAPKSEVTRATFENMIGFLIFLGSLLFVSVLLIVYLNKKKISK